MSKELEKDNNKLKSETYVSGNPEFDKVDLTGEVLDKSKFLEKAIFLALCGLSHCRQKLFITGVVRLRLALNMLEVICRHIDVNRRKLDSEKFDECYENLSKGEWITLLISGSVGKINNDQGEIVFDGEHFKYLKSELLFDVTRITKDDNLKIIIDKI